MCSVWDVRNHQVVKTLETSDIVLSLEIVNSNLFITADGKTVKLWDANSFQVVKSFPLPHKVESASYNAEKRRFAAGGEDMWVHLYDFDSGEEIDCNRGKPLSMLLSMLQYQYWPAIVHLASTLCLTEVTRAICTLWLRVSCVACIIKQSTCILVQVGQHCIVFDRTLIKCLLQGIMDRCTVSGLHPMDSHMLLVQKMAPYAFGTQTSPASMLLSNQLLLLTVVSIHISCKINLTSMHFAYRYLLMLAQYCVKSLAHDN